MAVFIGDADNEIGAGVDFAFQISYRHKHRYRHTHRKRLTHTETQTQAHTFRRHIWAVTWRHLLFVYSMCLLYSSIQVKSELFSLNWSCRNNRRMHTRIRCVYVINLHAAAVVGSAC